MGMLLSPGITRRERHTSADDGVRAQTPCFVPLEVHRTATTLAKSLSKAQDFGQRFLQDSLNCVADRGRTI